MSRIVVLISGSGSNLQALIDAQHNKQLNGAQIVSVISSSAKAYGLQRAQNAGITTQVHSLYQYVKHIPKTDTEQRAVARTEFEKELATSILNLKPDLIVCAGWLLILGPEFLSRIGNIPIINLHPALPGAFDGTTHAIELAWKKCQEEDKPMMGGCMVHYVTKEVDRGEPLVIKQLQLLPHEETLKEYEKRVHDAEHVAIVEATLKALDK